MLAGYPSWLFIISTFTFVLELGFFQPNGIRLLAAWSLSLCPESESRLIPLPRRFVRCIEGRVGKPHRVCYRELYGGPRGQATCLTIS
ncbi:hypothetical protein EV127DRAFT_180900 [Xylaria flabelliformis]|nr:hypothetical protein EV127DRAFT_180900 [Xylaria flabelliformis]